MITPRLKCIINYVNEMTAADIGTDHAYIPIELIKSGVCKSVIAADIKPGPLKAAENNIEKYGYSDKIETRLGSGLEILHPGETEVIIIAGMGGELICDILNNSPETAAKSKLILQPMNGQYELRKYLHENGFKIEKEDIENEGHRVYNLFIVRKGIQKPFDTDIEYHLPKYLYKHPKFEMLYNKKEREFKKIINGLENSNICDEKKLEYYKVCLREAERIKNESI